LQPLLIDFYDMGFSIYVVSRGSEEDADFLKPLGYDVLIDADAAWEAYGVSGIPMTFFIDRDGLIAATNLGWGGEGSLADFKAKVEDLVATEGGG